MNTYRKIQMKSRDFVYWLQGFLEVTSMETSDISLTANQVDLIRKHINLVFEHEIDPEADKISGKEKLDLIHGETKLRC